MYLCKSRVYDAVQETAQRVPGLKREQVFAGVKTPALGGDLTSVKCKGEWIPLGITVDPISGLALTIDALPAEDIKTLKNWIEPIATSVDAQVLVTDDADGFKTVADEVGVQHQVCKAHVKRNTEALLERYQPLVARDADGSLGAIGVTPEQAAELEAMHRRYLQAAPPQAGEHQSLAYRLRLLYLDRWNLWHRLTRYRMWKGPKDETLDGTNNACERAIGWWIKERYRTMRGYKVPENAVHVSRLFAWCGNFLNTEDGANLAGLLLTARVTRDLHDLALPDLFVPTIGRSRMHVVKIDPRHTSQTCSRCGHQARNNRRSQSLFLCRQCSYCLNADLNAALNIRDKYVSSLASLGTTLASGQCHAAYRIHSSE